MLGFVFTIDSVEESDKSFFEHLYKKYNRLMFSTAHHYYSDLCDCEDIVQDAIVNLCGKVKVLRELPSHALPAYISYAVKNVAINHYRHRAVVAKHTQAFADDEIEDQVITPQDYILLAELKADLTRVWSRLPEQDQELLYRKYIFEQNDGELAEIFHCRKENIRMRLSRARKRAAKLIEEEGIYEKA